MDIVLASSAKHLEPKLDSKLLIDAFSELNLEAQLVAWDNPDFDWSQPRLVLIHSTWDYHLRPAEFVKWAEQVSRQTQLWNPAEVVNWNSHKGYLKELAAAGIPVMPTVWLECAEAAPVLADLLTERGWTNSVLKPAISASAYGTLLVTPQTLSGGQAHLEKLLAHGTTLLQPYLTTLSDYGERNLIFIDGKLSHCIKRPSQLLENGERVGGELELVEPDSAELALAKQVLEVANHRFELLYARVDIVRDESGTARLLELEIIEPGLTLRYQPGAALRMAQAVAARLA